MTAPTLTRSSSTPLSTDTNVSTETDIVLVFDQNVDVESGNVVLYKVSDVYYDSIVETIAVTSGQVTGTGTEEITINPSVVLEGNTQYYLLIDATAFDNSGGESYEGIEIKTEFSFRTETVPQSIQEQIQLLAPSAIIELYQLHLTAAVNGVAAIYYYHDGTNEIHGDIVFNSITYAAVPCEFSGFKRSAKGTLPRPTFTVANSNNAISALLTTCNPVQAKIVRIRTCKKFLDAANFTSGSNATADPTAIFERDDNWYIDRVATENLTSVSFELTSKLDLTNLRLPRRQVLEHCPWKYRGEECGYVGKNYFDINNVEVDNESDDVCAHTLIACKVRHRLCLPVVGGGTQCHIQPPEGDDDILPFGGFPSARLQM